nr:MULTISPECIES: DUF1850 domain-containing protein [unclassified Haladaptatus]
MPVGTELVVEDADTGQVYYSIPVENGTAFSIEYTHSVEKTRVLDAYVVDGDRIVMTHMEFESYGWGLPARADVRQENGVFVFEPEWADDELYVKAGRIAGHRLNVNSHTYDLVAPSDASSVKITVEKRSALAVAVDSLKL